MQLPEHHSSWEVLEMFHEKQTVSIMVCCSWKTLYFRFATSRAPWVWSANIIIIASFPMSSGNNDFHYFVYGMDTYIWVHDQSSYLCQSSLTMSKAVISGCSNKCELSYKLWNKGFYTLYKGRTHTTACTVSPSISAMQIQECLGV